MPSPEKKSTPGRGSETPAIISKAALIARNRHWLRDTRSADVEHMEPLLAVVDDQYWQAYHSADFRFLVNHGRVVRAHVAIPAAHAVGSAHSASCFSDNFDADCAALVRMTSGQPATAIGWYVISGHALPTWTEFVAVDGGRVRVVHVVERVEHGRPLPPELTAPTAAAALPTDAEPVDGKG